MLDRQTILFLVIGVCIVNGIFSPYMNIAIAVSAALMPELFPRTIEWVLFWASILVASATLLFSGVPVALYERLARPGAEATAPMWLWLGIAVALSLPALLGLSG
jgi:heme/copper-type cytochrome/quinol oxidase subunit 3